MEPHVVAVVPPDGNGGIAKYTTTIMENVASETTRVEFTPPITARQTIQVTRRIWESDADVVHLQYDYGYFGFEGIRSFLFLPLLWIATIRRGLIITMHEVKGPEYGNRFIWTSYKYLLHLLLSIVADELIFLSENAQSDFTATSVPVGSINQIPHGINVSSATKTEVTQSEAKREFGLDPERPVVAQIGYINPRKNTEIILEIAEQRPTYQILIAGGPRTEANRDRYEEILDRAEVLENVTVTGTLGDSEFQQAFQATDVAVLAYRDIRQSGILNWAIAYDVPSVCSDIVGFQEFSDQGLIRTFNDVEEALNAVDALVNDSSALEEQMARYRDQASFQEVARRHDTLYRRVF